MRFPLATAACFGLAVISMSLASQPSAQPPAQGRLLVFNSPEGAEPDGGVRILRGSAAAPRAASDTYDTSLQVVAGERFWIFDPETSDLASCRNIRTANVGERELECVFGTFGRYRRTFGDNFRH